MCTKLEIHACVIADTPCEVTASGFGSSGEKCENTATSVIVEDENETAKCSECLQKYISNYF